MHVRSVKIKIVSEGLAFNSRSSNTEYLFCRIKLPGTSNIPSLLWDYTRVTSKLLTSIVHNWQTHCLHSRLSGPDLVGMSRVSGMQVACRWLVGEIVFMSWKQDMTLITIRRHCKPFDLVHPWCRSLGR